MYHWILAQHTTATDSTVQNADDIAWDSSDDESDSKQPAIKETESKEAEPTADTKEATEDKNSHEQNTHEETKAKTQEPTQQDSVVESTDDFVLVEQGSTQ